MSDPKGSPEEIESRIKETRNELRRDVQALEAKMSPDNLKNEVQQKAEQATERAVEGTRQVGERMREGVDETMERMGERSDLAAWGLIGTIALVGLGFVMMRYSQKGRSSTMYTGSGDLDERREYEGRLGEPVVRQ